MGYVFDWPCNGEDKGVPYSDFYDLEGIPGVYVQVKGDNIGKIVDYSKGSKVKPSLRGLFAHFDTEELKDKLLKVSKCICLSSLYLSCVLLSQRRMRRRLLNFSSTRCFSLLIPQNDDTTECL